MWEWVGGGGGKGKRRGGGQSCDQVGFQGPKKEKENKNNKTNKQTKNKRQTAVLWRYYACDLRTWLVSGNKIKCSVLSSNTKQIQGQHEPCKTLSLKYPASLGVLAQFLQRGYSPNTRLQ